MDRAKLVEVAESLGIKHGNKATKTLEKEIEAKLVAINLEAHGVTPTAVSPSGSKSASGIYKGKPLL